MLYFRPLDVVIMFLAYSAANHSSTKNTILSIFKERLKNGFFRPKIMEETFETFTPVGDLILIKYVFMYKDFFMPMFRCSNNILKNLLTYFPIF